MIYFLVCCTYYIQKKREMVCCVCLENMDDIHKESVCKECIDWIQDYLIESLEGKCPEKLFPGHSAELLDLDPDSPMVLCAECGNEHVYFSVSDLQVDGHYIIPIDDTMMSRLLLENKLLLEHLQKGRRL